MSTKATFDQTESAEDMASTTTLIDEPDLADRLRRLSVGSTETAFSIISDVPSVQSLDTNGSVNGGVSVEPPSIDILEICLEALTKAERASNSASQDKVAVDSVEPEAARTTAKAEPTDLIAHAADMSPYWLQFPGFLPNPTATFSESSPKFDVL